MTSRSTSVGTDLERAPQCRVSARGAIRVERLRVDAVCDPPQEPQARLSLLRQRRPGCRNLDLARLLARDRAQRRRRALAEPEARARVCALGQLVPGEPAREIGADVQHVRGTLVERDQRVERRDAVRLGRRNLEPAARVAERALRHPADAALCRADRREQQVPSRPVAARNAPVVVGGLADHRIDRRALRIRRLRREQAQVGHYTASTRMAVALNSAVPDFGSCASIVSTFVAHLVGEMQVHEREPRTQRVVVGRRRLDRAAP